MTNVTVEAGSCGFKVMIKVSKLSARRVKVDIIGDCEMVGSFGENLADLDWHSVLAYSENPLLCKHASRYIKHASCPVPIAVLKAIEVEVGVAVARDVIIHFNNIRRD